MPDLRAWVRPRAAAPIALLAAISIAAAACGSAASSASLSAPPPSAVTPTPLASITAPLPVSASAADLEQQMVSVIKRVNPSVVQIETNTGLGSGVVYDSAGHIVTNAHVVDGAKSFKVTMADGKVFSGTLVGSFAPDDVAVIKIDATGLTPAVFGDSSQLAVGDFVLAMGNPLGLQSSVTEGIVSALSRQVPEPDGFTLPDVIQTSAAINPGNSGGALVNLQGEVVGIPTLAASDPQIGGSAPGIGFAISSNRVRLIADQLIKSGRVTASGRPYMGVVVTDAQGGAGIVSVVAGGPAAKAGIKAGDTITAIDGKAIADASGVTATLASLKPGDVIKVTVKHSDGTSATLSLTLGQVPG